MGSHVVGDDDPVAVLDALASNDGPVAVVDHRRRPPSDLSARLRRAPADTWLVAFTAGSTDTPRGVCRTRESWQASVAALAEITSTREGSTVLVPGPLSSTLFLHAAWHACRVGGQPLIAPIDTDTRWDVAHLVPAHLRRLLSLGADVAGRTAVVAGAALDPTTSAAAARTGLRVVAYYGAAELSFVAVDAGFGLRAFPDAEVQARDGVLWARSPYLATGYLPGPSGEPPSAGALQTDLDGWASVGDHGRVDADGVVRVHGRGEAAIATGGATVGVADVERVLSGLAGVRDVVVAGVTHDGLGQVVGAAVESDLGTSALRSWARVRLDGPALPRLWVVVPALPRTPAGKVDRRAAAALLARERTGRLSP